jgi:dTMP kinase
VSGRGRFISFEGIDGSGKSSHIEPLAERLRARSIEVVGTREPGGTPVGEQLRELVLHQPMSIRTETLMMFAARAEHLHTVIEPALARGAWVLCDRFTDATFAYQCGGRGLPVSAVQSLADWLHPRTWPDLTLLFDLAPAEAARRLAAVRSADRFEAEQQEFFARVRGHYLERAAAEPGRFALIDATPARERVAAEVERAIARLFE